MTEMKLKCIKSEIKKIIFSKDSSSIADIEQQVLIIREEFNRINVSNLIQKTINWKASNCGLGGKMVYFMEHQNIIKIVDKGYEDDGEWIKEYYFQDRKLIFEYTKSITGPVSNPSETRQEKREYYINDKKIKEINNGKSFYNLKEELSPESMPYKLFTAKNQDDLIILFCN